MKDQDFYDFLDNNGIAYSLQGRSIHFQSCPQCGNNNWKVQFFRERDSERKKFYGKCFRNDCRWNSYEYLIAMGIEPDEVKELHGVGYGKPEEAPFDFIAEMDLPPAPKKDPYKPQAVGIKEFFHIEDWPEHPAAKYAVSRGYRPALHDHVMIDPTTNAMVFLCREGDMVCGWQKRFVAPTDPRFKTKNPPGEIWKKSQHILEYPGVGDICVVEGPATCMSAWFFGFHAVCSFGAAISQRQLELVATLANETGKPVAVAYDKDFAGVSGYYRIKNYMGRRSIPVYRIKAEVGNDLNDSWKAGKRYTVVEDDPNDSHMPPLAGMFEEFYD